MEPSIGLFGVCDGMGGHSHGEVAAELAIDALTHFVRRSLDGLDVTWPFGYEFSRSADANRLTTGIRVANREVWRKSQAALERSGMGTTIAALLVEGDQAVAANVGDSRVYRCRNNDLTQLSIDDTIVADLVSRGLLQADDQGSHPLRNALLQAAGAQENIDVHVTEIRCEAGDMFLLCTDGVYGVIPEPAIYDALCSRGTVQDCVEYLERKTLQLGGPDNIAIVLLKYVNENAEV
jgi:PPM family protein phosphatase